VTAAWRRRLLLGTAVALAAVLVLPGGARAEDDDEVEVADDPGRVLVFSLPGLAWADVAEHDLPNLEAFFADSALANLATRAVRPQASAGAAYLTISAGARATTEDAIDGQVLAVDEESNGSRAGDVFRRRTGVEPDGAFVALAWPSILRANAGEPYEAEAGLLADTLEDAGVVPTVFGNADGTEQATASFERQVGLALADGDGVVRRGELGRVLQVDDPQRPFGVRTDHDVLADQVAEAWAAATPGPGNPGGGVVLVEASDAARTLRYRVAVDGDRYDEIWAETLADADELFGRLMADVDPAEDTVLVVAPYNLPGDRDLTVAALGGRDIDPGFARSASTQRSGFLTLVDVAPTVLDRLGIVRPNKMEGRPAVLVDADEDLSARVDHLVDENEISRFRERLLTPTTTAVVLLLAVVVALAMAAHTANWSPRARTAIGALALWNLALLPTSFVARAFPLESLGAGFYWPFLLVVAAAVAGLALALGRWTGRPRVPLLVMLGVVGAVVTADVMTGSNLSLGAAFGYSATGNSRLYGVSNYAYPQLAVAGFLLAGAIAVARPGRRGRWLAVGLLTAVTVVLGVPIWGSDVGGVLAFTPSVVLFGMILWEHRVRLRLVVLGALATGVAITAFGLLDLSRPAGERAHLGRLFERVGNEGVEPLFSLIERKLAANLRVSTESLWVAAIPIALLFWAYLVRYPGRPYARIKERLPSLRAALAGALAAAVLGSLLNDSGAIVGGVASTVLALSLAFLLLHVDPEPATP